MCKCLKNRVLRLQRKGTEGQLTEVFSNRGRRNQWRIQDFPLGGADLLGWGTDLQCVHFSAKTYAKMKEMDPVGGGAMVAPPGSANGNDVGR